MVAKRIVESPQAMKALVGQELGVSDWPTSAFIACGLSTIRFATMPSSNQPVT